MEFAFPKMYPAYEAQEKIKKVQKAIFDLFEEYREMAAIASATASSGSVASSSSQGPLWPWGDSYWDDLDEYCVDIETNIWISLRIARLSG